MRALLLLLPLCLGGAYQGTVLVRGAITPVVADIEVPPIQASFVNLSLQGASYHELSLLSLGGGPVNIGERTYAEGAALDGELALSIVRTYPPISVGYVPPGTQLTFIFLDSFGPTTTTVAAEGFDDGARVEFAGNSLLGPLSGGPNAYWRSTATHTFLGTVETIP